MSTESVLAARLEASRQELLDLGLRNPLLNFRLSKAQGVAVVQEEAAAVYDVLVRQGKTMYFQAAPAKSASSPKVLGAHDELPALRSYLTEAPLLLPTEAERHAALTDNKLQTAEPLPALERRLLNTYYTARTSLEEQGVNILYLAVGQLVWYETASSEEPRYAPLVLLPVLLERGTAAERFKLRHTGAEVEGNLSLQAKLRASFGLHIPLPELDEETGVAAYLAAVAAAIAGMPRWQVVPDKVVLSFFSFSKFMLYRDLDPTTWPTGATLLDHAAIKALLGPDTGFQDAPPTVGEEAFLDTESPAHELHQVLDADSSQLLALLAVHEGRNLVVQGPPGTGKSQTIANVLAEAIGAGKKVLFVAEKMAALEVVKRRLDSMGLGAACLELHSHKANKKALHDELKATLSLGRPAPATALEDQIAQLPRYRATLNDYALAVNAPIGRSRRTAQQVAGELLRLRSKAGSVELPRLAFAALATWTDTAAAHAEALADRVQATLKKIGVPHRMLFWGSELTVLLPPEQDALIRYLREASAAVAELQAASQTLAHHLGLPSPIERTAAELLLPAARHAQLAPPLLGVAPSDFKWQTHAGRLAEAIGAGAAYTKLRQAHDPTLLPEAWGQQLAAERAALLSYGDKWWNFLSGDYRRARKQLQRVWRETLPQETTVVVSVIDAIHEAARHLETIEAATPLAQQLFGPAWQKERSDWQALAKTQEYLALTHERISRGELPAALWTYLAGASAPNHTGSSGPHTVQRTGADFLEPLPGSRVALAEEKSAAAQQPGYRSPEALPQLVAALEAALARQRTAVQAVVDALHLNEARRFGPDGRLQFHSFEQQQVSVAAWAADVPAVRLAVEWNNVAATVRTDGLPELVVLAERWEPASQCLTLAVRQTWLEFLQKQAFELHPALRQFERASHQEVLAHFRQADVDSLHHNRVRAMSQHHEQLPNLQAGGQMLLLRNEFARKRGHLPLRKLLQQAGRAIQAIKPVFMMSPLSVASYLPPGAVEFDLVVFDEASQVKPVDALGAIARGRQLVVVGDSRQLPPTSFFDSLTGSDEEINEENVTADIQSILELCKARQMPEQMLRWHYRSLHQSLIAASNHLFYDDKLVIFPSPGSAGELGLGYRHLPESYYERGTTRTNPLEAQAVAAAVVEHARTKPHLTLGVVAFSTAQRQAIQDALEKLRRQQPETEVFFNGHPHEPFFVKNLENVQGDERDVIFISIGYGRTKDGYLTMSFGPLNGDGGERRLNVLITRAKQRCEVFTNLTAADLDLSRTQSKGVAALKAFLEFAQHGRLNQNEATNRVMESPFEEVVHAALTARGYQLHPQVGSQGFYIDLAVVDPDHPGRYLLGIECDGAMYHTARSARDRDRLRQTVLENVGWQLHRIWSTDWFRDPARETERAVHAIKQARRVSQEPQEVEERLAASETTPSGIAREEPSAVAATVAEPYQLAQLPAAVGRLELHQHGLSQLANWLATIVRVESPVHIEEATRRLAQASGATQVGSRMRKVGQDAALLAVNLKYVRRQGDFLWETTMQQPPLRDRSSLPAISRKLSLVAPEELTRALYTVVEQSFTLPREAAYLAAVRLLGFSRLNDDMRQQLDLLLANLLERRELEEVAGILKLVA
ncbi:DUF3320 domain-containing protein [Hymenobacter tibetensis]|uniref:DUF3320 domain-containing protein n=1 Tax=Hymenobacter tibetensis TaxID=497967 RepID=A0ABY4CXJ6_9BACT|nr:DUF3320 domain-containing protein [Hymenobacter tibetensis]UOG74732.1 DUF3320 domain-containing protein [Hymenobacter tibetensis]